MDKSDTTAAVILDPQSNKPSGVKLELPPASSIAEDDAMSSSSSSSSGSGGEEDDESESERRRMVCLADMRELEQLFARLKEALIREKQCLNETKTREIEDETAEEFTHAVAKMKQNMDMRIRLATLLRDYKLQNARHLIEYEETCMQQSLMNDKTALFDRHVSKIETEIIQLEERRRQLNLDYNIYQLIQSEKTVGQTTSNEDDVNEQAPKSGGDHEEQENNPMDNDPSSTDTQQQQQQPQLRKSTRNKGPSIDSSTKTSASSSGIWSGSDLCTGLEAIRNQALGQLYARQLDPDAAPFIVYSLSDLEILEDLSIIKMNNSLNTRLNKKV